jgi:hypothetical protein
VPRQCSREIYAALKAPLFHETAVQNRPKQHDKVGVLRLRQALRKANGFGCAQEDNRSLILFPRTLASPFRC